MGKYENGEVGYEMEQIQTMIETILTTKKEAVLAMIVNVEESAYRKEGAWMLFIEGEEPIGLISAGCLEIDLHNRVERLFGNSTSEVISYDMSAEDDLGWGRGAGCNGVVHVHLRAIDKNFKKALTAVSKTLHNKEPVLFIQSMDAISQFTFSSKQADPFGFWDSDADWEWMSVRPFQKIVGQRKFGTNEYFIQLIWPKPQLYIIGAGIDARPLTNFASGVGYDVHLFDWREANCHREYFPQALSINYGNILSSLGKVQLSPLDSIVIMTHVFEEDVKLVNKLRNIPLLYFGILGSKKRTKRLLGDKNPGRIQTPVGLSIGADGPNEIAISIVAELIAHRNGVSL